MAIDIANEPTFPNMTYTHLVYTVTSSLSDQPQYQYVMDVIQDSVVQTRIKQYPNPNASGIFDPSRILNDYIEYDENWKVTTAQTAIASVQDFTIAFGEEYGTSISSSVTLYDGLGVAGPPAVTGSAVQVFAGVVDPNNGISYNWQKAAMGLTNTPTSDVYIAYDDYHTMTFYNDGSMNTVNVNFNPGNANNFNLPIGFTSIPIGGYNTGETANWTEIVVTAGSKVWTFKNAEDCNYERVRFAFINKFGFWDYYGVNLPIKKNTTMTKSQLTRPFVNYSSQTSVYDVSRRGRDYYNIQYNDNYSISTDWLDQEGAEWLGELMESPNVFVQQGTDFVPIIITNGTYVHNTNKRSQKTFQYELTYQYANSRLGR